jgi:ClpP class serine protease
MIALPHIVQKVYHEPWLLTVAGYSTVTRLIESKLNGRLSATDDETIAGFKVPRVEPTIDSDGVATISIVGILGNRISNLEKICGGVDYLDIQKATQTALDKGATGILYSFDSSGGMVRGCSELASYIKALPVETEAFTDSKANSAAYWLMSACNHVTATESSDIGSIGVILPWVDKSRLWEVEGLKYDAITNAGADLKGAGAGPSLTPAQRTHLQQTVDYVGQQFQSFVRSNRPKVNPVVFRAATYFGRQALDVGLVDQVGSFADAKRRLGSVSAPRREPVAAPAQALATQAECDRIRAKAEATLQRQIDHALAVKWAERFAERRSP